MNDPMGSYDVGEVQLTIGGFPLTEATGLVRVDVSERGTPHRLYRQVTLTLSQDAPFNAELRGAREESAWQRSVRLDRIADGTVFMARNCYVEENSPRKAGDALVWIIVCGLEAMTGA